MEKNRYILKNDTPSCHLLHVCCAPDLVISYLAGARGDVFFYNPNIHPRSEYEKRYKEVLRVAEFFEMNVVEVPYDPETFFEKTKGLESEPEGRKRCEICIRMRLEKTLEFAKENGYRSFSTTLTASPKKSVEMINNLGFNISKSNSVQYIPNVYRKSPLYNSAQKLIKQLGIYRQNYCGCVFSLKNQESKKGVEFK
ncbi:epoxyqueuosine reductase QueH [Fervidobacterium gondwanense]|uniref:epoxyqueuosine reductase QueH n=1 Tax=Fervidobacterium gondwanense TaxID=44754 RepID=UPI003C75CADC